MIEKIKPLLEIQNLDMQILEIQNNFRELPEKIFSLNNRIKSEENKIENLSQKVIELESISISNGISVLQRFIDADGENTVPVWPITSWKEDKHVGSKIFFLSLVLAKEVTLPDI